MTTDSSNPRPDDQKGEVPVPDSPAHPLELARKELEEYESVYGKIDIPLWIQSQSVMNHIEAVLNIPPEECLLLWYCLATPRAVQNAVLAGEISIGEAVQVALLSFDEQQEIAFELEGFADPKAVIGRRCITSERAVHKQRALEFEVLVRGLKHSADLIQAIEGEIDEIDLENSFAELKAAYATISKFMELATKRRDEFIAMIAEIVGPRQSRSDH